MGTHVNIKVYLALIKLLSFNFKIYICVVQVVQESSLPTTSVLGIKLRLLGLTVSTYIY